MSIKDKLFSAKNFFRNVWNFRAFLIRDRWFDWGYLLEMLRDKIGHDVKKYKTLAVQLHPEPVIKSMELCLHLIDRILADDYYDNIFKEGVNYTPKQTKRMLSHSVKMQQNDIDYLFSIMSKQIRSWWD